MVDNVRYRALTEPLQPLVYIPLMQRFVRWMFVHVRTARDDPMQALSTVRAVVADLDPRIGVGAARTLKDDVTRSLAEWQGPASLSGLLALVTLMLTVGGLYATLASSVSQRTKEMAIRRALGAQAAQVRRLVIRQGLLLTAVGLVLGLGATAVVMGYVASFLYDVTPRDLSTQIAVVGLVGLVAWLSTEPWGATLRSKVLGYETMRDIARRMRDNPLVVAVVLAWRRRVPARRRGASPGSARYATSLPPGSTVRPRPAPA